MSDSTDNAVIQIEKVVHEHSELVLEHKKRLQEGDKRAEALLEQIKGLKENIRDELKELGEKILDESKLNQDKFLSLEQHIVELPKKQAPEAPLSIGQTFIKSDELKELQRTRRGTAVVRYEGLKTTISSSTIGAGIISPTRHPQIARPPDQELTIRDLIPSFPTDSGTVEFVRRNAFTNAAAPQTEGSDKAESALDYELINSPVKTIAHWIPATKQVLDDWGQLAGLIDSELRAGLGLVTETQILSGDGLGQNLSGLITEATAYNTGLNGVGDTTIDQVRHAMLQASQSNYPSEAIVLNVLDWHNIELLKDTTDRYIYGNPGSLLGPRLWGRPVVQTNSMTAGDFLTGAFSMSATVWDRQQSTVDVSTEHSDFFVKNMVAIRAEERLALTVRLPGGLITGTFV